MAIEIVDFPINSMVIFNSYVKLPEGKTTWTWFRDDLPRTFFLLTKTASFFFIARGWKSLYSQLRGQCFLHWWILQVYIYMYIYICIYIYILRICILYVNVLCIYLYSNIYFSVCDQQTWWKKIGECHVKTPLLDGDSHPNGRSPWPGPLADDLWHHGGMVPVSPWWLNSGMFQERFPQDFSHGIRGAKFLFHSHLVPKIKWLIMVNNQPWLGISMVNLWLIMVNNNDPMGIMSTPDLAKNHGLWQLGRYSCNSHFIQYLNGIPPIEEPFGFINPGLTLLKAIQWCYGSDMNLAWQMKLKKPKGLSSAMVAYTGVFGLLNILASHDITFWNLWVLSMFVEIPSYPMNYI